MASANIPRNLLDKTGTFLLVEVGKDFRVGTASEHMAFRFQISSKLMMIVNFTIESAPDGSILISYWLRSRWREVYDAETGMDETSLWPKLNTTSIRASMVKSFYYACRYLFPIGLNAQPTPDSTHTKTLFSSYCSYQRKFTKKEISVLRRFVCGNAQSLPQ